MTTPVRSLRVIVAGTLLLALAACNGTSNTTSVNLSGTVSGLTDSGLILSNGISLVTVNSGATAFTFPSRVLIGSQYSVQVASLPPTLICTVAAGAGFAGDNNDISNVVVTCVARNNLGGFITGLAADGLVLANGSDTLRPAAGAQNFTFGGKVGQGFSYGVTVLQQPAGETCSVANGSGVMGTGDVNSVQVNCQ